MGAVRRRTAPAQRAYTARHRLPTSGGAALRSALVPGWGQWAAGARRRGVFLTLVAVALLAIPLLAVTLLVLPFLTPMEQLEWLTSAAREVEFEAASLLAGPDWRAVWASAIGLNLAVLLVRIWIALDAAMLARRAWAHASRARGVWPAAVWLPGSAASGQAPARASTSATIQQRTAMSLAAGTIAALVIAGPHLATVLAGYAVRPLLASMLVTQSQPVTASATPEPDAVVAIADPGRPLWNGTSRLNMLLLGTDRRPQESAERPYGNSDTILLLSFDPETRTAVMVSVPRDMMLDIPRVGQEKVNAAYREGGPELSVRVISDLLGVPIHRWASVDVTAFARIIDAVGGVMVDIDQPIRDDQYPAENYAIRRIFLPSGLQWLNGEQALWYARSRHGTNDFDRANRQQRLLLSLKDRARDPRFVSRLPALFSSLADAVQTDLAPREVLALARIGTAGNLTGVRSLILAPPAYGREVIQPTLYAIYPDVARIRLAVSDALALTPGSATAAPPPLSREMPVIPIDPVPDSSGLGSGFTD